ncbi:hypothetical protein P175DRAFT_0499856 [Aspergillus ochraceoroseus IBT 24754]|uniref:Uncharacterized protein n=1 Tax=Aspergillus ochraceoroseus IBT 24754 TaxID=1392256 RepID=A0A2T5M457_9EURO|nr:uncharacterized protein P175DRAFT_0499856 [Aspergillus ochraceoroseus IBT 24754]PTU23320.1 hypothetical protein P175DRAFT_0499856 [Aspergillus ochraceoroseus IBT 24754]
MFAPFLAPRVNSGHLGEELCFLGIYGVCLLFLVCTEYPEVPSLSKIYVNFDCLAGEIRSLALMRRTMRLDVRSTEQGCHPVLHGNY